MASDNRNCGIPQGSRCGKHLPLNRLRGTPAALELFSEIGGFSVAYTLDYPNANERRANITLYVTPSVHTTDTPEWRAYVLLVVRRLVPFWITVTSAAIAVSSEAMTTLRAAAEAEVKDFVWL